MNIPDGYKEENGYIINDKGEVIFDCIDYESDPIECLKLLKNEETKKTNKRQKKI
jgi:hypothetical protein